MPSKVPTTLLLNSDQSFCAFGYEAEDIYFELAVKDSESESEDDKLSKQNCRDFYYFQKLTLYLHQKDVSKFNLMLQRYSCDYTSSRLQNF